MKILLIVIVAVILGIFIYARSRKAAEIPKIHGSLKDIESHISKLMNTDKDYAFLIIEISGTDNFIQFSGDNESVQLDFPLATDRQENLESKFKQVAKQHNLDVVKSNGTDGMRFLDINMHGSPSEVAKASISFMEGLFGVSENTEIDFQLNI
jgi:hypothetical protein